MSHWLRRFSTAEPRQSLHGAFHAARRSSLPRMRVAIACLEAAAAGCTGSRCGTAAFLDANGVIPSHVSPAAPRSQEALR